VRLIECLRMRVKNLDFERGEILVREGKGNKDRVTMLPAVVVPKLTDHLERVRRLHGADLPGSFGRVALPHALAVKYPNAEGEEMIEAERLSCHHAGMDGAMGLGPTWRGLSVSLVRIILVSE
jgi:integrase